MVAVVKALWTQLYIYNIAKTVKGTEKIVTTITNTSQDSRSHSDYRSNVYYSIDIRKIHSVPRIEKSVLKKETFDTFHLFDFAHFVLASSCSILHLPKLELRNDEMRTVQPTRARFVCFLINKHSPSTFQNKWLHWRWAPTWFDLFNWEIDLLENVFVYCIKSQG